MASRKSSGEIARRPLGRAGVAVSALALGRYHLELYKTSKHFDRSPGRKRHKFPPLEEPAARPGLPLFRNA
jgi:hypothetical protein